jgi:hypothetical protein
MVTSHKVLEDDVSPYAMSLNKKIFLMFHNIEYMYYDLERLFHFMEHKGKFIIGSGENTVDDKILT